MYFNYKVDYPIPLSLFYTQVVRLPISVGRQVQLSAKVCISLEPGLKAKTDNVKFKEGVDETIQFQLGFPGGAVASCLSTYSMNNLDRFFLNGLQGFAELYPSTGYGPIKGRTNKGELSFPHVTHQTVQMDEMSDILLNGKQPIVPVDGLEAMKDLKIIDAIYQAVKTGKKVELKLA